MKFKKHSILAAFCTACLVAMAVQLWFIDAQSNDFILADWVINYEDGGFKRRGISGSLFFLIQDYTHIPLYCSVFLAQMACYCTFFGFFIHSLRKKEISFSLLILVVFPLTFLFPIFEKYAIGRKEILVLAIFAYFLHCLFEEKLTAKKHLFFSITLMFATLFHELVFFYTPYFILAFYLKNTIANNEQESLNNIKNQNTLSIFFQKQAQFFAAPQNLKTAILLSCYIVLPLFVIFAIMFFGHKINEGKSVAMLVERGLNYTTISRGIFAWRNDFSAIQYYRESFLSYILYLLPVFIGVARFGVFFIYNIENQQLIKKTAIGFTLCWLFSIPLFLAAIDWGRWIYTHFSLMLLLGVYFSPLQKNAYFNTKNSHFSLEKWLFCGLLFSGICVWYMPLCDLGIYFGFWLTLYIKLKKFIFLFLSQNY